MKAYGYRKMHLNLKKLHLNCIVICVYHVTTPDMTKNIKALDLSLRCVSVAWPGFPYWWCSVNRQYPNEPTKKKRKKTPFYQ